MAGNLTLEIVTPSRRLVEAICREVYLPGEKGEIGLLADHAPLVSMVSAGVVRYQEGNDSKRLAARSGFIQVLSDRVVLLADEAVLPGEVKGPAIAARRKEIESGMISSDVDFEGREKLSAELAWVDAQISISG